MTDAGASKPDLSSPPNPLRSLVVLAIVPLIVMAGLLCRSPNFNAPDQNADTVLTYPLGGDFLQEYVGGRLILDKANSRQLYDAETFTQVQHDSTVVGFSWDPQQFFPAVYPPYWYAAVSPLSKLSYAKAIRVWLVLMTVALIAALWLLNRYAKIPTPILIVMCLSAPVIQSLNGGQKGTLLLLILTSSYLLLKQRRDLLSGLVFALIAFKPHLAIAIGLWMLVSRNWRWCAGAILGVAAMLTASFVASPDLMNSYVNVVLGFGDFVQSGGYNLHESFSLWSFWQQLVGNATLAKLLTVVSSVLLLGSSLWFLRKPTSQSRNNLVGSSSQFDRSFAAMVIVTMLTSPHLYTYDLTMLLLPIGLLTRMALASTPAGEGSTEQQRDYLPWLPVGLLVLLMFANDAITGFALSSGFQAGVVLLLITWIAIMRPWFAASRYAS